MAFEEITQKDMQGAKNLIDFCDLQKGDNVLVMVGEETHPIVTKATELAIAEKGATTILMEVKEGPRVYGIFGKARPYEPVSEAYRAADVVIKIGTVAGGLFVGDVWEARLNYGVSYVMSDAFSLETLRSEFFRFPVSLVALIGEKQLQCFFERERGGFSKVHITSVGGTDYTCYTSVSKYGVLGGACTVKRAKLRRPGQWGFFPGATFAVFPAEDCPKKGSGVFIGDYIPAWTCPGAERNHLMKGMDPLRFTIEDDWVTEVKGGLSDEIVQMIDTKGDKVSRYSGGPMWGTHPKAKGMGVSPIEWYHAFHVSPLLVHLHMGLYGMGGRRGQWLSKFVTLPFAYKPTITINDDPIIVDGVPTELIIDKEVREEAAKYGNPDEILRFQSEAYEDVFSFRYGKSQNK